MNTTNPPPTIAELDTLLATKTENWNTLQNSHPGGNRYHVAAYEYARSCDAYNAAITRAAIAHPFLDGPVFSDHRAILANPPDYYASNDQERQYAETVEYWRAIVHPQSYD